MAAWFLLFTPSLRWVRRTGEDTMSKTTVALLVMLPLTAAAQERDLYLQFDGIVNTVQGCVTCTSIKPGDSYHGLIKIDASLAGRDRDSNPLVGEYGNYENWDEPSKFDFVTGFNSGGTAHDALRIRDERDEFQTGPGQDGYFVRDAKGLLGQKGFLAASVGMQTGRNVIFGDGVEQAFDVSEVGNERFVGFIHRGAGKSFVDIVLDLTRVTLTPGSCRP
jgi:hypothetical protein